MWFEEAISCDSWSPEQGSVIDTSSSLEWRKGMNMEFLFFCMHVKMDRAMGSGVRSVKNASLRVARIPAGAQRRFLFDSFDFSITRAPLVHDLFNSFILL